MAQNGDVMRSDRLKQVMQQIDSNFDERNAGFSRFSKFVTEAGNRGLLMVTRLENGQYEVAPVAGAAKAVARPAARPAAKPAAEPGVRDGAREGAREERPSRRRGRRGGRGRDREETGTESRSDARPAAKPAARPDGALTLASAFRLMTDALADLGVPTGNEQLRSRMVAMLGREDALLEEAHFARLLRQANDAEVADVRKIGEGDEYEVALSRSSAAQVAHRGRTAAPAAAEQSAAAPDSAPPVNGAAAPAAAAAARLSGMRFRRGSRSPTRPASMPLIGMVSIESDTTASAEPQSGPAAEAAPSESGAKGRPAGKSTRKKAAAKPRARKSTSGAKAAKASKAAGADEAEQSEAPAAKPAARRPRTRARKKAAE
jgi:hypothetical protein